MVRLLFQDDSGAGKTLCDPACGTGGMLSVAEDYTRERNPDARLETYGQELNPESYAICKADALVRALVNVGRSMGLSVIAEGVETQEQRAFLVASQCDSAQGYLYARPIPGDELLAR